jgi:hypothetical protein
VSPPQCRALSVQPTQVLSSLQAGALAGQWRSSVQATHRWSTVQMGAADPQWSLLRHRTHSLLTSSHTWSAPHAMQALPASPPAEAPAPPPPESLLELPEVPALPPASAPPAPPAPVPDMPESIGRQSGLKHFQWLSGPNREQPRSEYEDAPSTIASSSRLEGTV